MSINVNSLYDKLLLDGKVTIRGKEEDLATVKSRITHKKHRETKKLGEFADKSMVLNFDWVEPDFGEGVAVLEISLTKRGSSVDVEII